MAITPFPRPFAVPLPVHSDTQAPATSDPRPEVRSSQDVSAPGLLAVLSRRALRASASTASLTGSGSFPNRRSHTGQTNQPATTEATSVGSADVLTRLKATFGCLASSAPSDTSVLEPSLQCGFVHTADVLNLVYEGDKTGPNGVCAGLSVIWMNVHCAAPGGNVITRLQALASFEGMQHALIFQKLYLTNHKYLTRGFYLRNSIESRAKAQMNEIYATTRDKRVTKRTSSAAKMADAITSINGYASVVYWRTSNDGKRCGHEMSMHRNAEDGIITFFDPNSGEFRFKSEETAQFLRELRENYRAKSDLSFEWELTKVQPNSNGKSTPLDGLIDRVKADHASSSGEPISAP